MERWKVKEKERLIHEMRRKGIRHGVIINIHILKTSFPLFVPGRCDH